MDLKKYSRGKNEFDYELPTSKRTVTFKLLTSGDEKKIAEEIKAREKISKVQSSELTTRLKYMILSVDGNSDRATVNNFIDNEFLSRDSFEFRKHITSITPDVDMKTKVVNSSGKEIEVVIPITVRFFWPDTRV